MKNKIEVLKQIAIALNKEDISWGVGASMLMHLKGIDTVVNDIDIVIDILDLRKFRNIVNKYNYTREIKSIKYPTEHFYELIIKDIDIDIMFNFKVQTDKCIYEYPFLKDHLEVISIDGVKVYLLPLNDWLDAYKAMGRDEKVNILKKYLNR